MSPTERSAVNAVRFVLMLFSLVTLMASPCACTRRSCEDAEEEIHDYLEDCNIGYIINTSDQEQCSDLDRQLYECLLSCWKGASCEAVRGDAPLEEANHVYACEQYCANFIEYALEGTSAP